MAIGLGAKLARLLLLTFNLIFWLSGIGLVGIGIWLLVDIDKASVFAVVQPEGTTPMIKMAAYGILGIGCFVLLVGFLGCCGAMHENRCMLVTYFAILLVILLAEVVAGVLVVVYKKQLEEGLQQNMLTNLRKNYGISDISNRSVTEGFDFIQFTGGCCGVMGPSDYNGSVWSIQHPQLQVPNSCCKAKPGQTNFKLVDPEDQAACQSPENEKWTVKRHSHGCYDSVKERIVSINGILIGVGAGIAGLEMLGMIFAICLCRNIDYDI